MCADNSTGAAVWQQINGGGGSSPYTEIADGTAIDATLAGATGAFAPGQLRDRAQPRQAQQVPRTLRVYGNRRTERAGAAAAW